MTIVKSTTGLDSDLLSTDGKLSIKTDSTVSDTEIIVEVPDTETFKETYKFRLEGSSGSNSK